MLPFMLITLFLTWQVDFQVSSNTNKILLGQNLKFAELLPHQDLTHSELFHSSVLTLQQNYCFINMCLAKFPYMQTNCSSKFTKNMARDIISSLLA
jgi:hypothetical protein